jgi:hypothetical protein
MLVVLAIGGVVAWVAYNARDYAEGAERLWYNHQINKQHARLMSHAAAADRVAWDGFAADATKRRQVETDPIARRWNEFGAATIFCHGRDTESGQPILVIVEWTEGREGRGPHLAATYTVPGALRRWPAAYGPYEIPIAWPLAGETPKRFFVGQPDPNDPTRFTIRVESDAGNGTIDARLRDDPAPAYPPFKVLATWQPDPTTQPAATRPVR